MAVSYTFPVVTQLKNLADPTAASDAATKAYVDGGGGGGGSGNYSNANVFSYLGSGSNAVISVTGNVTTTANANVGNLTVAGTGNTIIRTQGGSLDIRSNLYLNTGGSGANLVIDPDGTAVIIASQLVAQGNVNIGSNYYFGNGAFLTGITASGGSGTYGNANVANYLPAYGGIVGASTINVNTVNAGAINANGISSLGPNSNVRITGGTSGQVLTTRGDGTLYWSTSSSTTAAAGGNTEIQINFSNATVTDAFASSPFFTYNDGLLSAPIGSFQAVGVGFSAGNVNLSNMAIGEIRATWDITAFYSSDKNLKSNIEPISDSLLKVRCLRGVSFDWNEDYLQRRGGEDGYFVRKHDIGVIAQEVQAVLPEIVGERYDGTLAVKYDRLTAVLIEAVKELEREIQDLKQQLRSMGGT